MAEISLAEALKQFLEQRKLQGKVYALQIEEIWETLMGKTIAQYTSEIKILGHTLFIITHIAPLKQELLYQKNLIIKRVNEALGRDVIKDLIIQ